MSLLNTQNFLFLLLLLSACINSEQVQSQNPSAMSDFKLSHYRWENRLLLIFAPNTQNADYQQQIEQLNKTPEELIDRNLLIFHFLNEGESFGAKQKINAQSRKSVQEKYKINPQAFTLLLIGKDGGVKLRKNQFTKPIDIFALIDTMPMRQSEMRRKKK